jgi:hypothetical protein
MYFIKEGTGKGTVTERGSSFCFDRKPLVNGMKVVYNGYN